MNTKRVLLVQPSFPIANKSYYHKDYFPIGLLKIASYLHNIERIKHIHLVIGNVRIKEILDKIGYPTDIYITSLFTYWADFCYSTIKYYSDMFPKSRIHFGGIYVSLMKSEVEKKLQKLFPKRHIVLHAGVQKKVEEACTRYGPFLELLPGYEKLNFIILHSMRGCPRRCSFCGTYVIEPENTYMNSNELKRYILMIVAKYPKIKNLVFYDNNLLKNPNILDNLNVLHELKQKKLIINCESQSGFDGRLLTQEIANKLMYAGFIHPRIAWDGSFRLKESIEKQISYLIKAGYKNKEISVFMLYNWDIPFNEMIEKLKCCIDWKIQVADCRYRPISLDNNDGYDPKKIHGQQRSEYYVHPRWEDWQVRLFRKIVRKANIMTRMNWSNDQYIQWTKKQKIDKISIGSSSAFVDEEIRQYLNFYFEHKQEAFI